MRRLIAGPLWFISTWCLYELLWSLTGIPRLVGPVLGLTVAGLVLLDPWHLFWSQGSDTTSPRAPIHLTGATD